MCERYSLSLSACYFPLPACCWPDHMGFLSSLPGHQLHLNQTYAWVKGNGRNRSQHTERLPIVQLRMNKFDDLPSHLWVPLSEMLHLVRPICLARTQLTSTDYSGVGGLLRRWTMPGSTFSSATNYLQGTQPPDASFSDSPPGDANTLHARL